MKLAKNIESENGKRQANNIQWNFLFFIMMKMFAVITTVQQKNQAKQIEELVPKRGPTSVAWTWFSYEKCDMEEKTAQIIQENGPHHRHKHNKPSLQESH